MTASLAVRIAIAYWSACGVRWLWFNDRESMPLPDRWRRPDPPRVVPRPKPSRPVLFDQDRQ